MTNKIKSFTGGILMASFIMSPVMSFAKNNDDDRENESQRLTVKTELRNNGENEYRNNENKDKEDKEERNCLQIFAHLVGGKDWKNENNIQLMDCWLPFGIAKKWRNGTSTTSLDTKAPIISNLSVKPKIEKVKVKWITDEKSTSEVFFGTTSPVGVSATSTIKAKRLNKFTREHEVSLKNLTANTTYFLVVKSKDKAGNTSVSAEVKFTTLPRPIEDDNDDLVIKNVVTITASSSIKVGWRTNEPSTSRVYHGVTSPIDVNSTSTLRVEDASLKTNHILTLSNLSANTNYFMVIESKDGSNHVQQTDQFSVSTLLNN